MTAGSLRGKWVTPQPVQAMTWPADWAEQAAPHTLQNRVRVRQYISPRA